MARCSYCGKENAPERQSCDGCGTPLASKPVDGAQGSTGWSPADKRMMRGALWCGGGLIVTLVTYVAAASGGTYVVAWGAIAWGAVEFFQGLSGRSSPASRQAQAHEILLLAAQLESIDRAAALAKYAELVKAFPGTPAAREGAHNLKLLQAQDQPPPTT